MRSQPRRLLHPTKGMPQFREAMVEDKLQNFLLRCEKLPELACLHTRPLRTKVRALSSAWLRALLRLGIQPPPALRLNF